MLACAWASTIPLTVKQVPIRVEVADTPGERSQGLMYRDSIGADSGMLFVYPDRAERRFWMKNTKVPLTIAFLADDGAIVHLADMQPMDTNTTASTQPVRYALEMPKGWFARHAIQVGDRVGGLPPAAAE